MLRYYLAVGLRHMARSSLYAAISVGGLAIAFAAATLIALYVHDELDYDRWIPNYDRIYQVSAGVPGRPTTGVVPSDFGLWLEADFPQLEAVTRLFPAPAFLQNGDTKFNETVYWADANVFEVFRFPVVAGNLTDALERPDGLVLTRELAVKYFGRPDAVGETLLLDGEHPMEVTAVIEDFPSNTHFQAQVFAPGHAAHSPAAEQDRAPIRQFGAKLWNTRTYFLLPPGEPIEPIRAGMPAMLDRHTPSSGGRSPGETYPIMVRPIAEIHLSPGMVGGPSSDLSRLYTVSAVGLLIVTAAVINFVNLLTALGIRRAVEVGVRKAVGASRRQLIVQFMSESALYVAAAAAAGLVLAAALLPVFNAYLLRTMDFAILTQPGLLAGALLFLVLVAVLAGLYPSAVLSAFRPAIAMKARAMSAGVAGVRQGLVVVQFGILIGLLIATVVIYRQMEFGTREALWQAEDPILLIQGPCSDALKAQLIALPGVRGAACSLQLPQLGIGPVSGIRTRDGDGIGIRNTAVDFGFFELYGLKAVAGRFFSPELGTDRVPPDNVWTAPEALVINETGAEALGFGSPEQAVGQLATFNHMFRLPATFTGPHDAEIIGVVEDFQIGSVRSEIFPAAFYVDPEQGTLLSVKLDGATVPETLDAVDRVWEELGDGGPIRRRFFDEAVQRMYLDIRRQMQLFSVFAGIAILISVLGLVGLAAHAAATRTKEIGIRKTLGGKRGEIMRLLVWQFSKPVLWANVLAWPAAYYVMSAWLQGFARRVDPEPWIFLAATAVALLVALATVSLHAYSMAGTRPVSALRYE